MRTQLRFGTTYLVLIGPLIVFLACPGYAEGARFSFEPRVHNLSGEKYLPAIDEEAISKELRALLLSVKSKVLDVCSRSIIPDATTTCAFKVSHRTVDRLTVFCSSGCVETDEAALALIRKCSPLPNSPGTTWFVVRFEPNGTVLVKLYGGSLSRSSLSQKFREEFFVPDSPDDVIELFRSYYPRNAARLINYEPIVPKRLKSSKGLQSNPTLLRSFRKDPTVLELCKKYQHCSSTAGGLPHINFLIDYLQHEVNLKLVVMQAEGRSGKLIQLADEARSIESDIHTLRLLRVDESSHKFRTMLPSHYHPFGSIHDSSPLTEHQQIKQMLLNRTRKDSQP